MSIFPQLKKVFRRYRWTVVALCAAVALISLLTTRSLPSKPMYEVRYETHIRNYVKHTIPEHWVLDLTDVAPYDSVVGFLRDSASRFPGAEIRTNSLRTIIIRACCADPDSARCAVRHLYALMVDTVQRAGDSMCVQKAAVYRYYIDSLRSAAPCDSTEALVNRFTESLAALESDAAAGCKYVDLLNSVSADQPHRLPSRWLVVLGSLFACLLICLLLLLLKSFEKDAAPDED